MRLSEKIYTCRKKAGLSQDALAQKLGVSRQAVSKWETGESSPEIGKLKLLGEIFGVTTDWLLSEEEEEKTPPRELPRMPGFLKKQIKKYGPLAGIYIMCRGLLAIGVGVLAHFLLRRMFGHGAAEIIANSPAAFMANLIILFGAVLSIGGLGLSLYLRHRLKNKK